MMRHSLALSRRYILVHETISPRNEFGNLGNTKVMSAPWDALGAYALKDLSFDLVVERLI